MGPYQNQSPRQISEFFGEVEGIGFNEHLERAYQPQAKTITLNMDVAKVWLNIEQAIPCGFIGNELVSNALQRAFPNNQAGTIEVRPTANEAEAIAWLIVADNGISVPIAIDFQTTDTLGLQRVNVPPRSLRGTVAPDRKRGTKFSV